VAKARAIPKMEGADLVKDVTCDRACVAGRSASGEAEQKEFGIAPGRAPRADLTVAAYDFGVKWNILRRLDAYGCDVTCFPAKARPQAARPQSGRHLPRQRSGRPTALDYAIANVKTLVEADGRCSGSTSSTRSQGTGDGRRDVQAEVRTAALTTSEGPAVGQG
jgi:carbamoyl-phosphate synthase small subunit